MATIPEPSLFRWDCVDQLGDLERLLLVLDAIPDEPLMQLLERQRRNGRNDYPVRPLWNSLIAGFVFGHDSIASLRRELLRNAQLREVWSCPTFVDTLGVRRNEEATMPKTHRPYAPEFRQQMVELVQSGRTPEELALEYEPSAAAIRNWVAQQERDAGRREDGLSSDERQELRRLRRENKQLRIERDILKKAAAWFARESDSIPERGSSS